MAKLMHELMLAAIGQRFLLGGRRDSRPIDGSGIYTHLY